MYEILLLVINIVKKRLSFATKKVVQIMGRIRTTNIEHIVRSKLKLG